MKLNQRMASLLKREGITWPLPAEMIKASYPELEVVSECVLLKNEYEKNTHVKIEGFPDKTGFECFMNHVHLPCRETRESLMQCFEYTAGLEAALTSAAQHRRFRVIVAICEGDCIVRFHQLRPDEDWLSDDLEGDGSEAMLIFDVPAGDGEDNRILDA